MTDGLNDMTDGSYMPESLRNFEEYLKLQPTRRIAELLTAISQELFQRPEWDASAFEVRRVAEDMKNLAKQKKE